MVSRKLHCLQLTKNSLDYERFMKLLVGLGNPGKKYEKTRHNLGFMVVEQFLKDFESTKNTVWEKSEKFKSDIAIIDWQPKAGKMEKVILVKPKTYMNNSGMAVSLIKEFYKISTEDIWILHDDIDLQPGALRIRKGGGTAGHRGLDSLLATLGTGDFWRFRLGIGRPEHVSTARKNVDDFVLGEFSDHEWGKIRELIKRTAHAMETALEKDLHTAMNQYNTK